MPSWRSSSLMPQMMFSCKKLWRQGGNAVEDGSAAFSARRSLPCCRMINGTSDLSAVRKGSRATSQQSMSHHLLKPQWSAASRCPMPKRITKGLKVLLYHT